MPVPGTFGSMVQGKSRKNTNDPGSLDISSDSDAVPRNADWTILFAKQKFSQKHSMKALLQASILNWPIWKELAVADPQGLIEDMDELEDKYRDREEGAQV